LIEVSTHNSCKLACREAADDLVKSLKDHANKKCLLLVSGGSSAKVADWAASDLDINVTNSTDLAQVDERFGAVGHDNSNWRYLTERGLNPDIFNQHIEILKLGVSAADIAITYSKQLQHLIDEANYKVVLLGLGEDGHIAGMLPMADEAKFDELFLGGSLVASYVGDTHERITITAKALLQMDKIVVYACGPAKLGAVNELNNPHNIHEYPAEILKRCNNVVVHYGSEET